MTLKARESTIKTIAELSRQQDDLNKTLLAKQEKLEALEYDPPNDVVISEEELCRQAIVQAYKVIRLEIRNIKEKIISLFWLNRLSSNYMNLNIVVVFFCNDKSIIQIVMYFGK